MDEQDIRFFVGPEGQAIDGGVMCRTLDMALRARAWFQSMGRMNCKHPEIVFVEKRHILDMDTGGEANVPSTGLTGRVPNPHDQSRGKRPSPKADAPSDRCRSMLYAHGTLVTIPEAVLTVIAPTAAEAEEWYSYWVTRLQMSDVSSLMAYRSPDKEDHGESTA